MNAERDFIDAILANPGDDDLRAVYADWLEEQGDPRGELLRLIDQLREIEVPNRQALEAHMRHLLYVDKVPPVGPFLTNSIGMKFALIPPGKFLMGSPEDEHGHEENENQVYVELTHPFYLGIYPVTQSEYK